MSWLSRGVRLQGSEGMRAVKAAGTGVVAGVRAIRLSADTLFWFEVDSAAASGLHFGRSEAPFGAAATLSSERRAQEHRGMPPWARSGRPLFEPGNEPRALQAQPPLPVVKIEEAEGAAADMRRKSKAWSLAGERSVKPRLL